MSAVQKQQERGTADLSTFATDRGAALKPQILVNCVHIDGSILVVSGAAKANLVPRPFNVCKKAREGLVDLVMQSDMVWDAVAYPRPLTHAVSMVIALACD